MNHRAEHLDKLIELLRKTADMLEAEDNAGLTGIVLVVEGAPGRFVEEGTLTASWVSMQGGSELYSGLLSAGADVAALREFKEGELQ